MNTTTDQQAGLYTPGKIRTYTGRFVDPFDMKPDDIDIMDIAHSLAHQCRFGGHTKRFHSIARHSINVTMEVDAPHKLAALLHDASEAYLLDIPTPIKKQLPGYSEAEDRLMHAVAAKFGFAWPMPEAVKSADRLMLEIEWHKAVIHDQTIEGLPWMDRQAFLDIYYSLIA